MVICNKKLQSGRSMIEMLGVLAIVGILSAGGIAGYSMAMQSQKTSALMEKVNLIATQTRSLYESVYKEDVSDVVYGNIGGRLIAGNLMPDLNSPFGGVLKTSPSEVGDVFTIETLDNVPQQSCVRIMLADWGDTGTIMSISADGTEVEDFPMSPEAAASVCADKNVKLIWTVK